MVAGVSDLSSDEEAVQVLRIAEVHTAPDAEVGGSWVGGGAGGGRGPPASGSGLPSPPLSRRTFFFSLPNNQAPLQTPKVVSDDKTACSR